MRVLWIIHLYPPVHNCGAEYMAHDLNKFLISQGHTVKVLLRQGAGKNPTRIYTHDDVLVFPASTNPEPLIKTSDIIFTHLDYTMESINLARRYGKRCVHFVHNGSPYTSIQDNDWVEVVYNSEWIKEVLNYKNRSFVLRPPCDWRYYSVERGDYITMINLDENKGGHVLKKIANALPDKKFLAVLGSYSATGAGQITDQPTNVKIIPNTSSILDVYRQTKILIMPSLEESWGRTATEAMCSGIPVVVSATKGLVENCDFAGLYVQDREDIDQWVRWLKRLDDDKFYTSASQKALQRSRQLDPITNMQQFLQWI